MAYYSRHVPGQASPNRLRSGHGQSSNHDHQSSFAVGDSQLYEEMMSISNATSKPHELIVSRAAPVSQADLSLKTFCDNLTAGGPTLWKSLESSVNGHSSHVYQYPIPSSEEGHVDQLIAPEEFDVPHLHATTRTRNSTIGPQQLYFSNRSDTIIQPTIPDPTSEQQNASGETSRTRPASKLTRNSSMQNYDASQERSLTNSNTRAAAVGSRPAETKKMTSGAEALASMDSSETLGSPHNPFTNSKLGASASTYMLPKNDTQNLGLSAEKHYESLTSNSERDDANNGQMLLPNDGTSPTLPAGKVFPIQIGSELFKLSGASISSDGKN